MKLRSIAIIPDGNRRFAKRNKLSVENAYASGFKNVEKVMEWAGDVGVGSVTFWALSLENYQKRGKMELSILFSLMRKKLRQALKDSSYEKNKVRVKFFGKLDLLPKDLQEMMEQLMSRTAHSKNTLSIAIAYSGREEILNATRKIAIDFYGKEKQLKDLTEKEFEKYLYSPLAPDLIIRTGAVSRLSGFLPWQTAYSELYFCDKLWPEFGEADFRKAVDFYNDTERRFGR